MAKLGNRSWIEKLKGCWQPKPLQAPTVDPALPMMNSLQRAAESFRYTTLRTEFWMAANGQVREWFRINLRVATVIGLPSFIVVPIITFVLSQFTSWTSMLVAISKNLLIIPLIGLLAFVVMTGVYFAARVLIALSK